MADDTLTVDAEPIPDAGDLIRQGESLVRIENQTQMVIAVQRPRNEAEILKEIRTELKTYPEMADEAIYSKPVGRESRDGPMKYAEGLSVRAAESLAYRWGNNGFGAEIVSDDGEVVKGVAVFVDFERNARRTIPFSVPRKFRRRDGTMGRHSEDRFFDIVVPAKQSKALREVILRSIAPGLKKEYEKLAREILAGSGADRVGPMLRKFAALGVDQKAIEESAGKAVEAFKPDDFARFLGVYTAIMDGDTTVAQAFGKETAEKAGSRPVSVGDVLAGGKGGLEEGRKPGGKEDPPKPKGRRGRPKGSKNKKKGGKKKAAKKDDAPQGEEKTAAPGNLPKPPGVVLWSLCMDLAKKDNPDADPNGEEVITAAEKTLIEIAGEADLGKIPADAFAGYIEKVRNRLNG